MKKRWICLLLLLLPFLLPVPAAAAAADDCGAAAMILYEPRTGTVLEEKQADTPMLIASTTKIMTALVALEHCTLSDGVTVTEAQAKTEGSSIYMRAGETYTVEELLYGLMLASGNDAAIALAEHTAGSVETFVAWMNEKAAALELSNTHFANPHGLDDPEHYSTARDLALLTAAAMENPDFCRIFATEYYPIHGVVFQNHNKLLADFDGCIGGKTGYTRAAGRTLVSCAQRGELRLICVTLSDPDDWLDHRALYESAFASCRFINFPDAPWKSLPVISSTVFSLPLQCSEPYALLRDGITEVAVELPRFVFAPVRAGDVLGTVTVRENGKVLLHSELTAAYDAPEDPAQRLMPWERFSGFLGKYAAGSARETDIFL